MILFFGRIVAERAISVNFATMSLWAAERLFGPRAARCPLLLSNSVTGRAMQRNDALLPLAYITVNGQISAGDQSGGLK